MRPTPWMAAEPYRKSFPGAESSYGDDYGYFIVPSKTSGQPIKVIVSGADDLGWEHVSVSMKNRCPNWQEMCQIKAMFWGDEEDVMQLHPAQSQYINCHDYCLHMWRPTKAEIPMPPRFMVGPYEGWQKDAEEAYERARA